MAWPGGDGESGDGESTLEDPAELQRQCEQQQHERLNEAGCLDGFKDVILDALPLIDDLFDSLTWRSMGLQRYRAVVAQAARNLSDEHWREFVRKSTETMHKQDDKVFDRLMTDAEPMWRRTMEVTMAHAAQAKRQGSDSLREYLYICTSSPSRELLEFFHSRSWRVVVRPPRTSWQAPKAGRPLEGATGYPLAIVDLSFPPASEHRTTISVMEEEEVEELEECETEELEELEEPKLKRSSSRSSSNSESKMPSWLAEALLTKLPSMEAHLAQVPLISSGLGKIGVTRSGGIRRRFFAIQQALAEALRTLAPGGVLVISWCGLAVHPILPFLAHSLRPAFRRVHVLCPPDTETFETYILAADFDSDGHPTRPAPVLEFAPDTEADDPPAAISKFAFFDWLRSPLRRCMTGYDDAVAWSLSQRKALEAEVLPKYQHSANNVRRMSNYNRPWLTAMTGSESKANLDPEARCDEMWSLYAEKLRLLAERFEEGSVPMELLPPKPAYRNNATTRWGLAASRLPIDLSPSSLPAEAVRGESKAASKTRSGSKRSGSKRPKSKEPPPRKTSKSEPAAPLVVPVSPLVVKPAETSPVEMRPVEMTAPPVEVAPVPKVEAIETSSATDSSSVDVPPVVVPVPAEQAQASAEVVQDVELPQESQFSEDDFFRLYGEQNQDATTKVRRPKIPATVSGRLQGTMWMSSTLGGASGLGPDILSMMRRSSLLKGAFEKINLADQSSLPDLYRAAWRMPKPKSATSPGAPRPHSGQSRLMAPATVERRPHSTASTRRPKPLATLDVDRPFSAGTGPKKGPKRAERKRR